MTYSLLRYVVKEKKNCYRLKIEDKTVLLFFCQLKVKENKVVVLFCFKSPYSTQGLRQLSNCSLFAQKLIFG